MIHISSKYRIENNELRAAIRTFNIAGTPLAFTPTTTNPSTTVTIQHDDSDIDDDVIDLVSSFNSSPIVLNNISNTDSSGDVCFDAVWLC